MKHYYIISENENGKKLYFNRDFAAYGVKFGTKYNGKRAALEGIAYARKNATSQTIIDHLSIEEA